MFNLMLELLTLSYQWYSISNLYIPRKKPGPKIHPTMNRTEASGMLWNHNDKALKRMACDVGIYDNKYYEVAHDEPLNLLQFWNL